MISLFFPTYLLFPHLFSHGFQLFGPTCSGMFCAFFRPHIETQHFTNNNNDYVTRSQANFEAALEVREKTWVKGQHMLGTCSPKSWDSVCIIYIYIHMGPGIVFSGVILPFSHGHIDF